MHAISVDSEAAAGLATATADTEVWDEDGRVLGLFIPEAREPEGRAPGEPLRLVRIRVCGVAAEKLRAAETETKVRDAAGWLLGHFVPRLADMDAPFGLFGADRVL